MDSKNPHSIIKESMKSVKQEIVITLPDGTIHLIYLHDISYKGKQLIIDFSTPSEDRKDELGPYVKDCIMAQVNQKSNKKAFSLFWENALFVLYDIFASITRI